MALSEKLQAKLPQGATLRTIKAEVAPQIAQEHFQTAEVPPYHLVTLQVPRERANAEFLAACFKLWEDSMHLALNNGTHTDNGDKAIVRPYLALDFSSSNLETANFLGLNRALLGLNLPMTSTVFLLVPDSVRQSAPIVSLNIQLNVATTSNNFKYVFVPTAEVLIQRVQQTGVSYYIAHES